MEGLHGNGEKQSEVSGVFVSPGVKVWDFEHNGEGTFEVNCSIATAAILKL